MRSAIIIARGAADWLRRSYIAVTGSLDVSMALISSKLATSSRVAATSLHVIPLFASILDCVVSGTRASSMRTSADDALLDFSTVSFNLSSSAERGIGARVSVDSRERLVWTVV